MHQRTDETTDHDNQRDVQLPGQDCADAHKLHQGFFAALLDLLITIADLFFYSRSQSPWLTAREGERYAHVAHGVIRHAISTGELTAHQRKRGSTILIRTQDLDA